MGVLRTNRKKPSRQELLTGPDEPVADLAAEANDAIASWESNELATLGIVDRDRVSKILTSVYDLADRSAERGRVNDVCRLLGVIRDFAKLESETRRRPKVPATNNHQHIHLHGDTAKKTASDNGGSRLSDIAARFGF